MGATVLLATLGLALAAPLPFVTGQGTRRRVLRIACHLLALQAFAGAGLSLSRAGRPGGGWLLLLGFVLVGIAWLLGVRRRILDLRGERLQPALDGSRPLAEAEPVEPTERLEPMGRAMLYRLLSLRELPVHAIATPREEIVYANLSSGVAGALEQIRASGFLRIPMADGSLDRIVGIVHAKDVLRLEDLQKSPPPLKSVMRRALFVGAERSATNLLDQFRTQRSHLAIVVDTFNRTVGIVTRDDLFRHLSGGEDAETGMSGGRPLGRQPAGQEPAGREPTGPGPTSEGPPPREREREEPR
jgi:CBS domain-containing protein